MWNIKIEYLVAQEDAEAIIQFMSGVEGRGMITLLPHSNNLPAPGDCQMIHPLRDKIDETVLNIKTAKGNPHNLGQPLPPEPTGQPAKDEDNCSNS